MPDYTDLTVRYTKGESKAVLVFNFGATELEVAVNPLVVMTKVATADQLTEALRTPGVYDVLPGSYVGNFFATADNVSLHCRDGVEIRPKVAATVMHVNGSNFTMTGGTIYGPLQDAVVVGSDLATTVEAQPNHVLFQGMTVQALAAGSKRGFALHGRNITLSFVNVFNYYKLDQEVQAVWACNGPGPYTITDCHLEAAGENILFGGAMVNIPGCIPSDITIKRCLLRKPPEWNGKAKVKNILEIKNGVRVLIEGNVLDGCWASGQAGIPVVFTPRNTAKAEGHGDNPWITVDQVVFRGNVIRNCPAYFGVNILGNDDGGRVTQQVKNITIEDNYFEDTHDGILVGSGVTENLTIRRNTFGKVRGSILLFGDANIKSVVHLEENAGMSGVYPVNLASGNAGGGPKGALDQCCSSYTVKGNILERTVYTNGAGQKVATSYTLPSPDNLAVAPGTLGLNADGTMPGGTCGWSGYGEGQAPVV